jgi:hypothetical protein
VIKSLYKLEYDEKEPALIESTQQEAADKVITLHDDEPEMVARMLLCLYSSDYPIRLKERKFLGCPTMEEFMKKGCPKFRTDSFEHETNPLLVHSKVYAMADKYDMSGLQAICVGKLEVDIYEKRELQNLVNALPHIYSSTPPSQTALKQKAAALVQKSYNEIMHKPKLKTKLEIACVQSGQLGWDVLSNLFGRRYILCAECEEGECEPFDDDFKYRCYGGICVCGMTQLCGSGVCSNLIKEKWICTSCSGAGLGKMEVREGPFPLARE